MSMKTRGVRETKGGTHTVDSEEARVVRTGLHNVPLKGGRQWNSKTQSFFQLFLFFDRIPNWEESSTEWFTVSQSYSETLAFWWNGWNPPTEKPLHMMCSEGRAELGVFPAFLWVKLAAWLVLERHTRLVKHSALSCLQAWKTNTKVWRKSSFHKLVTCIFISFNWIISNI